jgi:hypothetical protein
MSSKQDIYNYFYKLGSEYASTKLAKPLSDQEARDRLQRDLEYTSSTIPEPEPISEREYSERVRRNKPKPQKNKSLLNKVLSPKITKFKEPKHEDKFTDRTKQMPKSHRAFLKQKKLPKPKGVSLKWRF